MTQTAIEADTTKIMLGIGGYIWRLIPANPILLRVVETGGKRRRDLFFRCGYLGLLICLVIFVLFAGGVSDNDLGQLARKSQKIFQSMSYLQLGLVALLAPIFTAGAITQEKDSQTYDILLSTPLTNGQIVLGSLLSRLFFVLALLISGIPIFSITQIFGGVAIGSIIQSFLIAAATAFITGSLAMAIATFKVGTRRTIFSFYLFIMIYLVGLFLLDKIPYFHIQVGTDSNGNAILSTTSWFTGIHPFLALQVIFNNENYLAPDPGALPAALQGRILRWYWSSPQTFYPSLMFFLSALMVLPSIVMLRRLAQSTNSFKGWILQKVHLSRGDRTRKPRGVWNNPIAWREARTKASAARASVVRYGFMTLGLIAAIVMVVMFSHESISGTYINRASYDPTNDMLSVIEGETAKTYQLTPQTLITYKGEQASRDMLYGDFLATVQGTQGTYLTAIDLRDIARGLSMATVRELLMALVIVEFAVILLIVTNAAASTVTREKEDGSLDLLLTTPITSRYYIWGKLRGLVSYVLPLVAVPVASALIFVFYDIVRRAGAGTSAGFEWIVLPEALIIMPGLLIIVAAFASILGMHMSLRCRTTVRAVMSSVGIVMGVCAGLGWCGFATLAGGNRAGEPMLVIGSFSPFTVLAILIDPKTHGGSLFTSGPSEETTGRFILTITAWIATGLYALIVWTMYKSMVKNFDMTIRRQSR